MREKYQTIWRLTFLILAINIKANHSQSCQGMYYVARKFPSEKNSYKDSVTDLEITMLTTSAAKDNKIYQTHPSWTADGSSVLFCSEKNGNWDLFLVQLNQQIF